MLRYRHPAAASQRCVSAAAGRTGPLFALPISYLVRGERSSNRAVAGAATAVGGVALLAFSSPTS